MYFKDVFLALILLGFAVFVFLKAGIDIVSRKEKRKLKPEGKKLSSVVSLPVFFLKDLFGALFLIVV